MFVLIADLFKWGGFLKRQPYKWQITDLAFVDRPKMDSNFDKK